PRTNPQHQRQPRPPIMHAEQLVTDRNSPIHERSFFKITNPIHIKSHPILPLHHFACSFCVNAISIVEQRRSEHARHINRRPKEKDNDQRSSPKSYGG